jgi:ribosomal protein S3AE
MAEQQAKPAAAGKGSRRVVDKWKKKKWFTINASAIFDKKPIAETPAEKPKNLTNRTIRTTLDTLTGNRMKRDWYIYLKTSDIQGQNISTKLSKFEMNKGSLGRSVRRRNSKIALTEKIPVINGEARFTIVAITDKKATRKQEAGIREVIRKELLLFRGKDFEEISKELLLGNLTGEIAKKTAKIFLVKKVIPSKGIFTEKTN